MLKKSTENTTLPVMYCFAFAYFFFLFSFDPYQFLGRTMPMFLKCFFEIASLKITYADYFVIITENYCYFTIRSDIIADEIFHRTSFNTSGCFVTHFIEVKQYWFLVTYVNTGKIKLVGLFSNSQRFVNKFHYHLWSTVTSLPLASLSWVITKALLKVCRLSRPV